MPASLQIHEPEIEGRQIRFRFTLGPETYTNSLTYPVDIRSGDPVVTKLSHWLALISAMGLFSLDYTEQLTTDFGLSASEVAFFEKLFFFGLGEFRITNILPIGLKTTITPDSVLPEPDIPKPLILPEGVLLLNGGGKDASVSAMLLTKLNANFNWFQRGNTQAQVNVVAAWDAQVSVAVRRLDPKCKAGPYSGHRPISSGIAFTAVLYAYLQGDGYVIASNEASANESNFTQDGVTINHQYSKSLEFERDIRGLFESFRIPVSYFSLLRPLHELQIALLTNGLSDTQLQSFTSCNHGTWNATWCLACAKCAFLTLIMTAAGPQLAKTVWGHQAINDPALLPHLIALIDPDAPKPFECVGTLEECHLAVQLIMCNNPNVVAQPVHQAFDRYVKSNHNPLNSPLLTALAEHEIPQTFAEVLPVLSEQLHAWIAAAKHQL